MILVVSYNVITCLILSNTCELCRNVWKTYKMLVKELVYPLKSQLMKTKSLGIFQMLLLFRVNLLFGSFVMSWLVFIVRLIVVVRCLLVVMYTNGGHTDGGHTDGRTDAWNISNDVCWHSNCVRDVTQVTNLDIFVTSHVFSRRCICLHVSSVNWLWHVVVFDKLCFTDVILSAKFVLLSSRSMKFWLQEVLLGYLKYSYIWTIVGLVWWMKEHL